MTEKEEELYKKLVIADVSFAGLLLFIETKELNKEEALGFVKGFTASLKPSDWKELLERMQASANEEKK